ncbi:MAG: hypothetical protein RLP02_09145 [Coleofasciculus sp. C2-GNP5-27]
MLINHVLNAQPSDFMGIYPCWGDQGSRIFYPGWQDFWVEVLVFVYSESDDNLTVHGIWKTSLQTSLLQGERL